MHSGLSVTIALGEAEQHRIINLLLNVAVAAFHLCDDTADDGGDELRTDRASFDTLSAALDKLDELPDDQPGYVMEGPAKAAWALRALLGRNAGVALPDGANP